MRKSGSANDISGIYCIQVNQWHSNVGNLDSMKLNSSKWN